MKQYYLNRLHWIFNYTSSSVLYCIFKTLCLVLGVPLYAVAFAVEMILTFVNMLFCWIPVLNVVITVVCKGLIFVVDKVFYICILPDLKAFREIKPIEESEYQSSEESIDEVTTDKDV